MFTQTSGLACFSALFLVTIAVPSAALAADAGSASGIPDRLNFPEAASITIPKIIPAPAQQEAVPLPTPQFTGMTAIAVMTILLGCRKSILRLVS